MGPDNLASDYQILVSRSEQRPKADLYPFGLRDRIPLVPLPLQTDEDPEVVEPIVDLQSLLHNVYDLNRLEMEIDYSIDPVPQLSNNNATWVNTLLQEQQLR